MIQLGQGWRGIGADDTPPERGFRRADTYQASRITAFVAKEVGIEARLGCVERKRLRGGKNDVPFSLFLFLVASGWSLL